MTSKLTKEYILSRFEVDFERGALIYRQKPVASFQDRAWNAKYAGKQAGSIRSKNSLRRRVGLDGRVYAISYIIWIAAYDKYPEGQIDHIDRDALNNKLSNLRDVTENQNKWNTGLSSRNKSGVKGVKLVDSKWKAGICAYGRKYHIGYFATIEEATIARDKKAAELHGKYAVLNFPSLLDALSDIS